MLIFFIWVVDAYVIPGGQSASALMGIFKVPLGDVPWEEAQGVPLLFLHKAVRSAPDLRT